MQRNFSPERLNLPQDSRARGPSDHLIERFSKDQFGNRSRNLSEKAIDQRQREIFISMERASQQKEELKAQREQELRNIVLNENKAIIEEKERQRNQQRLREAMEAQERNSQLLKQLEEEKRHEMERKNMMKQMQAQGLHQQIIQKNAPPGWNDPLRSQMGDSMNREVHAQLEAKKARMEWQKKELMEERRRAALIDKKARDSDEAMRANRIYNQEVLKALSLIHI